MGGLTSVFGMGTGVSLSLWAPSTTETPLRGFSSRRALAKPKTRAALPDKRTLIECVGVQGHKLIC